MTLLAEQIAEACDYVRQRWSVRPQAGIILGSGLHAISEQVQLEAAIKYGEIPRFLPATALGHHGRLVCGKLAGASVVVMDGRNHVYEGYPLDEITLPVRVMRALGAELLIVTNAAGGLNPYYSAGDLMLIDDHINLMFDSPLSGPNDESLGPRFPDMSCPYDRPLAETALAVARRENFPLHRGVYIGLKGPCYETRAEYRFLRRLGGDAVGMSTVPEVIAAVHGGFRVLGLSVIANVASPDQPQLVTAEEVCQAADGAAPRALAIITGVLAAEFRGDGR